MLLNTILEKRKNNMKSSKSCECTKRLIKLENILKEIKSVVAEYKDKSSLSFSEQDDFNNEDFHHGYRSALWCTVRRFEKILTKHSESKSDENISAVS